MTATFNIASVREIELSITTWKCLKTFMKLTDKKTVTEEEQCTTKIIGENIFKVACEKSLIKLLVESVN